MRNLGADGLATDDHLQCLRNTDQSRQTLRASRAGQQSQFDLGQSDLCALVGNSPVCCQCYLEAATQCGAVQGHHNRFGRVFDGERDVWQQRWLWRRVHFRDVGPGGHFFGTPHTQSRYKTAFYAPIISDWRNYETWAEAGSPTALERANKVWKERLASYEEPYMDPAIRDELNAFVEKRKAEGGAPTDF